MPLNIPGILVPFQLLIFPRFVVPGIVVKGHIFFHLEAIRMVLTGYGRKTSVSLTFLHCIAQGTAELFSIKTTAWCVRHVCVWKVCTGLTKLVDRTS